MKTQALTTVPGPAQYDFAVALLPAMMPAMEGFLPPRPEKGGEKSLSTGEAQLLAICNERIGKYFEEFWQVGLDLITVKTYKLWREKYDSFEAYCKTEWGFKARRARQLQSAAEVHAEIEASQTDVPKVSPKNEAQARPLASLPAGTGEIVKAWKRAREIAGGGMPTARDVERAVDERTPDLFETANAEAKAIIEEPNYAKPNEHGVYLPEVCQVLSWKKGSAYCEIYLANVGKNCFRTSCDVGFSSGSTLGGGGFPSEQCITTTLNLALRDELDHVRNVAHEKMFERGDGSTVEGRSQGKALYQWAVEKMDALNRGENILPAARWPTQGQPRTARQPAADPEVDCSCGPAVDPAWLAKQEHVQASLKLIEAIYAEIGGNTVKPPFTNAVYHLRCAESEFHKIYREERRELLRTKVRAPKGAKKDGRKVHLSRAAQKASGVTGPDANYQKGFVICRGRGPARIYLTASGTGKDQWADDKGQAGWHSTRSQAERAAKAYRGSRVEAL